MLLHTLTTDSLVFKMKASCRRTRCRSARVGFLGVPKHPAFWNDALQYTVRMVSALVWMPKAHRIVPLGFQEAGSGFGM